MREVAPEAEMRDVSGSVFAYSRLVAELWRDAEAFLIVEQDIIPSKAALDHVLACGCEWSISPYKAQGLAYATASLTKTGLGCTRFRSSLMREFPQAVNRANAIDDGGSVNPPGHWRCLDYRLYSVLRAAKYQPHLHVEVVQHHVYAYGCSCGEEH